MAIPAMQGLYAGNPPAVSVNMTEFDKRPEAKVLAENKDALTESGIGLYRSLGGDIGVLFNQFYISGQEIQAADKAGQLAQIAPPIDTVSQQVASSGANHPAMNAQTPEQFRQAGPPVPPQAASSASPMAPGAQKAIAKARTTNMQPGGPTEGAAPVAGRILNQILKPAL